MFYAPAVKKSNFNGLTCYLLKFVFDVKNKTFERFWAWRLTATDASPTNTKLVPSADVFVESQTVMI